MRPHLCSLAVLLDHARSIFADNGRKAMAPALVASQWNRDGCPICGARTIEPFFAIEHVPARDGILWSTPAEAASAPTGDIRLSLCTTCGYIGNEAYAPDAVQLTAYDFSLDRSPTYRRFIRRLCTDLIARHDLRHKTILDVGCGDASFLKAICEIGGNRGVGIEPAFEPDVDPAGPIEIVRQDYSAARAARRSFDLVSCRHVLSEVEAPKALLTAIRKGIRNRAALVYLEVPNAVRTFRQRNVWNVVYEHRSWFLPEGLMNLCEVSGLTAGDARTWLKGEYLSVTATPTPSRLRRRPRHPPRARNLDMLRGFAAEWPRTRARWASALERWRRRGQHVVAWGAGARAVTFFHLLDCRGVIESVIDVNPRRWGKYLPVSAVRVDSPEAIRKTKPDVILITNPTYAREIRAHARRLGVTSAYNSL